MAAVSAINLVVRYQPDMARCVKALLVLLERQPTANAQKHLTSEAREGTLLSIPQTAVTGDGHQGGEL